MGAVQSAFPLLLATRATQAGIGVVVEFPCHRTKSGRPLLDVLVSAVQPGLKISDLVILYIPAAEAIERGDVGVVLVWDDPPEMQPSLPFVTFLHITV
jgi:hypothetical protein